MNNLIFAQRYSYRVRRSKQTFDNFESFESALQNRCKNNKKKFLIEFQTYVLESGDISNVVRQRKIEGWKLVRIKAPRQILFCYKKRFNNYVSVFYVVEQANAEESRYEIKIYCRTFELYFNAIFALLEQMKKQEEKEQISPSLSSSLYGHSEQESMERLSPFDALSMMLIELQKIDLIAFKISHLFQRYNFKNLVFSEQQRQVTEVIIQPDKVHYWEKFMKVKNLVFIGVCAKKKHQKDLFFD